MAVTTRTAAGNALLPAVSYRVLVGDHTTKRVLAELPASEIAYTDELNVPGSATVTVPLEHPTVTPENVWPGRRCLFIERAGRVVWGGWIVACRASGASVQVNAEGWWHYIRRRYRMGPWTYTAVDQLAIVRDILNALMEDAAAMPIVDPVPATSGVLRSWEWIGYDKTAGQALEELSAMDSGFEWSFTFDWTAAAWPQPTLHLHYPWRGTATPYVISDALPLVDVSLDIDSTTVAWNISVFGRDNPDYPDAPWTDRWAVENSEARYLGFPGFQVVEAQRDVEDLDVLHAIARDRMRRTSDAPILPAMTVATGGLGDELENVTTGDSVWATYRRGWLDFDGRYRVTGRHVDVAVDRTEQTTYQLAPSVLAGGPQGPT